MSNEGKKLQKEIVLLIVPLKVSFSAVQPTYTFNLYLTNFLRSYSLHYFIFHVFKIIAAQDKEKNYGIKRKRSHSTSNLNRISILRKSNQLTIGQLVGNGEFEAKER